METNNKDNQNQKSDTQLSQEEINKKYFNPWNPLQNNSKKKLIPPTVQKQKELTTIADKK